MRGKSSLRARAALVGGSGGPDPRPQGPSLPGGVVEAQGSHPGPLRSVGRSQPELPHAETGGRRGETPACQKVGERCGRGRPRPSPGPGVLASLSPRRRFTELLFSRLVPMGQRVEDRSGPARGRRGACSCLRDVDRAPLAARAFLGSSAWSDPWSVPPTYFWCLEHQGRWPSGRPCRTWSLGPPGWRFAAQTRSRAGPRAKAAAGRLCPWASASAGEPPGWAAGLGSGDHTCPPGVSSAASAPGWAAVPWELFQGGWPGGRREAAVPAGCGEVGDSSLSKRTN